MGPGDVRELPYDEQLLFVTGHPPLRCKKVRYYRDRQFKKRLLPPPPGTRDRLDLPRRPGHPWVGVRAAVDAPPPQEEEAEEQEQAPPKRRPPARVEVVAATDRDAGGLDRLAAFGEAMDAAAGQPAGPAAAEEDAEYGY